MECLEKLNLAKIDFEKYVTNKKILAIGPALEFSKPRYSEYDIIVRFNRDFPSENKTDIIYSNLSRNCPSVFNEQLLLKESVKFVVYPRVLTKSRKRRVLHWINNCSNEKIQIKIMSEKGALIVQDLKKGIPPRPKDVLSTGILGIIDLCQYPIKHLHVVGFSFFQTEHKVGYFSNDWTLANYELHKRFQPLLFRKITKLFPNISYSKEIADILKKNEENSDVK